MNYYSTRKETPYYAREKQIKLLTHIPQELTNTQKLEESYNMGLKLN